jgi:hypothetical protein
MNDTKQQNEMIKKALLEGRAEAAIVKRTAAIEQLRASAPRPPEKGLWTETIKKFTVGPYADPRLR